MRIKLNRLMLPLLIALLALALSGCRVRTGRGGQGGLAPGDVPGSEQACAWEGTARETAPTDAENAEPGENTRENPDARRKEFDENAPVEIAAGAERLLHGPGQGSGAPNPDADALSGAARLDENAADTALRTLAAAQSDRLGISEEAEAADSAITYYDALLRDRLDSLFECKRLYAYWETADDHVTVYKTSPEHGLLLDAGVYDVSARLLAQNLRVDDSWICRKDPGVIVKIVDPGVLGGGVSSQTAARALYQSLLAREGWAAIDAVRGGRVLLLSQALLEAPHLQTAARLLIAQTAYPELFADTDADEALRRLAEEAVGGMPAGIYYYNGQEGS